MVNVSQETKERRYGKKIMGWQALHLLTVPQIVLAAKEQRNGGSKTVQRKA